MHDRGWTASKSEVLALRLMEWLYDASRGRTIPRVSDFPPYEDGDLERDDLETLVNDLESRGLVNVSRSLGGTLHSGASLTGAGEGALLARRDRRRNARARTMAAREALLDWLYQQKREGVNMPSVNGFMSDPRSFFEGEHLSQQEVQDAGEHLAAKGLIKAAGAAGYPVLRANIKPSGEDVVEQFNGSLTDWAAAQRGGGHQFITHLNSEVSGQVGIGEHVTQTQTHGLDAEALLALVRDVRDTLSTLQIAEQPQAGSYLDVIQAEATTGDPDPHLIRRSIARLQSIASRAGDAGLVASVNALVEFVARSLGG